MLQAESHGGMVGLINFLDLTQGRKHALLFSMALFVQAESIKVFLVTDYTKAGNYSPSFLITKYFKYIT